MLTCSFGERNGFASDIGQDRPNPNWNGKHKHIPFLYHIIVQVRERSLNYYITFFLQDRICLSQFLKFGEAVKEGRWGGCTFHVNACGENGVYASIVLSVRHDRDVCISLGTVCFIWSGLCLSTHLVTSRYASPTNLLKLAEEIMEQCMHYNSNILF